MRLPLPSKKLLLGLGIAGVILLLPGRVALATPLGIGLNVVLVILAAFDAGMSVRAGQIRIMRELPSRLYTGVANPVSIRIENHSGRSVRGRLRDDYPPGFTVSPEEIQCRIPPASRSTLSYRVTAPGRGEAAFGDTWLRWRSPLGLLLWQCAWPAAATRRVYPRAFDYSRYAIEQRAHLMRQPGSRRLRAIMSGGEFESLRDYVPGDDPRRIDWKATARHDRLVCRHYEEERSKTIMVMVDCGRMMAPVADGLSKLDHAVNAVLMLASAGIAHSDRVGLIVFHHSIERHLTPRGDRGQIGRLLDALYDVQPRLVEPDYAGAFAFLNAHHRRRSLVVLITDLIDEAASEALLSGVAALRPAHLPLLVTIRDESVERAALAPLRSVDSVYRRAVAEEVLLDRAAALHRLRARGVVTVDAAPAAISVATVNQYLALKAENRI